MGKTNEHSRARSKGGTGASPVQSAVGTHGRGDHATTRADSLVGVALFLTTFLLYIPSYSHPFLEFDDPKYIYENPIVQRGLSVDGFQWAFTTNQFANWLPVTWLSHMLDCQLYGMNAHGHHVTNGLLHALNAALVFLLMRMLAPVPSPLYAGERVRERGSLGIDQHGSPSPQPSPLHTGERESAARAFAVAALFAVHPLRVESVSWIAERKDVLCASFFLLTLIAYVWYCRKRNAAKYGLVLVLYALGLMSKTMIVTLPCVLLLLDYWPLSRFRTSEPRRAIRLLIEKIPLLLLAIVSSIWTLILQRRGGALSTDDDLTIAQRFGNAAVSIPRYLAKMIRPVELSAFYPHPGTWPALYVVASVVLILTISVAVLVVVRRAPYLAVGWFWFLGMLVPVSGLAVQAGGQSMADRYTYLPGVGLLIAVVWGVADFARNRPHAKSALKPVLVGILALFAFATVLQQRYWSRTRDLFEQAVAVDPNNWYAHGMLGFVHSNEGDETMALVHYEKALAVKPMAKLWLDSGISLYLLGRNDEAIQHYRNALAAKDGARSPDVHYHLGNAFARAGQKEEASKEYAAALRLNPAHNLAWTALSTLQTR